MQVLRRDYLNEFSKFLICSLCHEQMITSGFKPNFKFEKCKGCNQMRDYLNEFNECNSCEKCKKCNYQKKDYLNETQICNSCSSGNKVVDNFLVNQVVGIGM